MYLQPNWNQFFTLGSAKSMHSICLVHVLSLKFDLGILIGQLLIELYFWRSPPSRLHTLPPSSWPLLVTRVNTIFGCSFANRYRSHSNQYSKMMKNLTKIPLVHRKEPDYQALYYAQSLAKPERSQKISLTVDVRPGSNKIWKTYWLPVCIVPYRFDLAFLRLNQKLRE